MPKKGEKVVSEEQLEKLALARQKALEVRRANKEIKDKEKELVRLEKEDKKKNLDKRINAHKKEVDMAGNEVEVEQSQKQKAHNLCFNRGLFHESMFFFALFQFGHEKTDGTENSVGDSNKHQKNSCGEMLPN